MSELYELPNGWEWKYISEVLSDIKTGTTPPKKEQKYYDNPSIKWFSPSDFGEHKELVESKNKINEIAIKDKKAKIYQPNSLLLVAIGATVGKIGIVRDESSSNQQITSMRFKDDVDIDYSYYWFVRMKQIIIDTASAATLPIINQNGIKSLPFPLPPLSEQQRIVSKLDLLFEKIDKSIALHQKNMDESDLFMGSVLNDVFGELEEKYDTKTVDEVSLNVRYGYIDSAKDKGNAVFIRITDINENGKFKDNFVYVDIEDKELEKFKLYKGDILVARSGATAGKVALFDLDFLSVFASYLIRIQPNNEMDSSFFFYFCHSPKYWEQLNVIKVGGAQPNVNATNLKQLKIATPPINIQQKVVKYLDEVSEKIEKVKSVQKEKMDSLKELKASILDKAFRGEL